jgi:alpha-tubulin suppressor-like RCC1 family protein
VRTDHTLWCWGANVYGQFGDGTTNERLSPGQVTALGDQVASVAIGSDSHICAVMLDHTLRCAGDNTLGALGDGTNSGSTTMVTVAGLSDVVEVAGGIDFTCARKSDGTIWCWGGNDYGQIGDGSKMMRKNAVQVSALGAGNTRVVLGWDHACALKADQTVWCWGRNGYGMLGDGTFMDSSTPVQASGLGSVTTISSGPYDVCARKSDGTLWCWGADTDGQLNNGMTLGTGLPEQISALGSNVADSDEGFSSSWALKSDHSVWYWGFDVLTGVTQQPGLQAAALIAGDDHECVIDLSGVLMCWGNNFEGQLGDGTKMSRATPFVVPLPCP